MQTFGDKTSRERAERCPGCHPERSEGSLPPLSQTLRCAQGDRHYLQMTNLYAERLIIPHNHAIITYASGVGMPVMTPDRHQPEKPAHVSVGARVVGMGGVGLYGRPLLVCDPAGQQEKHQGKAGGRKGPHPASSPLPPLQMVMSQ